MSTRIDNHTRDIIDLFEYLPDGAELTRAEVCDILGITENQFHDAKRLVRKQLGDAGDPRTLAQFFSDKGSVYALIGVTEESKRYRKAKSSDVTSRMRTLHSSLSSLRVDADPLTREGREIEMLHRHLTRALEDHAAMRQLEELLAA